MDYINNRKNYYVYVVVGLFLILIAGFREIGLDRDSPNYVNSIYGDVNYLNMEPTFWVIAWFNRSVLGGNDQVFFLIYALLGVSLKLISIYRLSIFPLFALFAYISMYFILHEMTQIRVGIASAIFLLALPDIYGRHLKSYLSKIFVACLFHYSSVILLVLYFLNPHKINRVIYSVIPIIGILFFVTGLSVPIILNDILYIFPNIIANKLNIYIYLLIEDNQFTEFKIYTFYHASLLVFYYVILYNIKYFKSKYQIIYVKIFAFMLLVIFSLSSFPVLAGRISQLLGIVLIILLSDFVLSFKHKIIPFILILAWFILYFQTQLNILGE